MLATAFLAGVNTMVLVALLYFYVRNARKITSSFTVGLTLFAGFLLTQNALGLFSYGMMNEHFAEPIEPFMLSINAAEAVGLVILYRTTAR